MTRLLALGLALALLAAATPARAEAWLPPLPDAKPLSERDRAAVTRAYQSASRAFARRRYTEALGHADRAFTRLPNASTALIRATILEQLGRPEDALMAYLAAADLGPTADEVALIDAGLTTHGTALGVGWVRVEATPEATTVFVDGTAFSGHRTVALPAGLHELILELDGHTAQRPVLTVRAGAGATLATTLAKARALPSDPGGGRDGGGGGDDLPSGGGVHGGDDGSPPPSGIGWVVASAGLAIVLVGVGTHVAALDAADEASALAHPNPALDLETRRSRYDEAVARTDTLEFVTWLTYGLGAAVLAAGVFVIVDEHEDEDGDGDTSPLVTLTPIQGGAVTTFRTVF